ncbi:hypothetical protein ColKHC_12898 [Colletotrichum higginsianum]|nr:hypothetical protein ColKHC_12898 [Colletotrichum higginsianum]
MAFATRLWLRALLFVAVAIIARSLVALHRKRLAARPTSSSSRRGSTVNQTSEKSAPLAPESKTTANGPDGAAAPDKTHLYKELYYKLQNLEKYTDILPRARQALVGLLHEALLIEQSRPRDRGILDIQSYDRAALHGFLFAEHTGVLDQWEQYSLRRAAGQGPELFRDRDAAEKWLKQAAPTKYVDGAWLGHVHKITTPFALRPVTRDAWQVLSEELGDGDLEKNHVHLYRSLLESIGLRLPDGSSAEFIDPDLDMGDEQTWKSATAQLLISLFPNEFLPEMLGFNMHYELLTLETLMASRELPELGISGYYFLLHVSIDNADSGHTAMALATVTKYLDLVQQTGVLDDLQEAWRRIQAGYVLSRTVGGRETLPAGGLRDIGENGLRIVDIMRFKANVSQKLHCASRVRIGKHKLMDWLAPSAWGSSSSSGGGGGGENPHDFLHALANATPWVRRGNSKNSLLVRELSWKGRMFGAFTNAEVEELCAWVDSLGTDSDEAAVCERSYRRFVGGGGGGGGSRQPASSQTLAGLLPRDHTVDHAAFLQQREPEPRPARAEITASSFTPRPPLRASTVRLDVLLPLWFAHAGLLENTVNTPYRTARPLGSQLVRILRAEYGFMPETDGAAGMDEYSRPGYFPSLVGLGNEIRRRHQLPEAAGLKDVLGTGARLMPEGDVDDDDGDLDNDTQSAVRLARQMLDWAARPVENEGLLLGLGYAFVDLEEWVAEADEFLFEKEKKALRLIVGRKRDCFKTIVELIRDDAAAFGDFVQGYELGRDEIERFLGEGA